MTKKEEPSKAGAREREAMARAKATGRGDVRGSTCARRGSARARRARALATRRLANKKKRKGNKRR